MAHDRVDRVEKSHLLSHDGVTMVGESVTEGGNPILVVSVKPGSGLTEGNFPPTVQGIPVVVEEREAPSAWGVLPEDITANESGNHRGHVRPVEGGTSCAPLNITGSGTLSFNMTDGSSQYISSNQHVFSAGGTSTGANILQPSASDFDLSQIEDVVAGTYDDEVTPNDGMIVDMAWGKTDDNTQLEPYVHGIGEVRGVRSPESGDAIVKSGRTTGVSSGEVDQTGVSMEVEDSNVTMEDQIITTSNIASPGDSGSPIMHDDGSLEAAGVLWGGNAELAVFSDATNWEGESGLSIMTTQENKPPSAGFTASVDGLTVVADGSQSSDPDGNITSYQWSSNGVTATGQTATFEFPQAGTYWITLTVTDHAGATDESTKSVAVSPDECTYKGIPRGKYVYTGDQPDLYDQWVNCEITTFQFQNRTTQGEGTAALEPPGGGTDLPDIRPLYLAVGVAVGVVLLTS